MRPLALPPPDPDSLDMQQAATASGCHYDTLRKHWRAWSNPASPIFVGFPLPYRYPPPGRKGALKWRASAIAEWKLARERALGVGRAAPQPPSRVPQPAELASHPRLSRQRAELAQLMERA